MLKIDNARIFYMRLSPLTHLRLFNSIHCVVMESSNTRFKNVLESQCPMRSLHKAFTEHEFGHLT